MIFGDLSGFKRTSLDCFVILSTKFLAKTDEIKLSWENSSFVLCATHALWYVQPQRDLAKTEMPEPYSISCHTFLKNIIKSGTTHLRDDPQKSILFFYLF